MVCAQRPRVLNDVTKPGVLGTGASWTVHHRHDEILDFLRREVDEGGDSNYTPVKVLDLESIAFEQDCVAYLPIIFPYASLVPRNVGCAWNGHWKSTL